MINDISVRPKAQNKNADRVFYTLLIIALAFVFASYFIDKYKGLISLGALICVVAALVIYNRYMSGGYSYDIVTSYEAPLFIVRKTVGKKTTTVYNVELSAISEVEVIEAGAECPLPKDFKRYNFRPTLGAVRRAKLTVNSRYEKAVLLIEGSDEFFDALRAYADEARLADED